MAPTSTSSQLSSLCDHRPSSFGHASPTADGDFAIGLSLSSTPGQRADRLRSILFPISTSKLSLETTKHRTQKDDESKANFRKTLLGELRKGWTDARTEHRFLEFTAKLERDGCAVFAGLIDHDAFSRLIKDFSDIMTKAGSQAFLHSFAPLSEHPNFIRHEKYGYAMIHPLLIAMLSYAMAGPIRITDARGKDTLPISVNAQDNMLHVDNTPFRQEYKMLMAWEKGQVKGPSGQNFTFLPGTHKATRVVRFDEASWPWSTENDSIFITPESIQTAFDIQKAVIGQDPTVVEVEYSEQPITAIFDASSLVHHRYRNKVGNARSCVIAAFHLASEHPGSLLGQEPDPEPRTMADMLMGHLDGTNSEHFCTVLGREAPSIETKMSEILDTMHHSKLVDFSTLSLKGAKFERWRETTLHAPSATRLKLDNGLSLCHDSSTISRSRLIEKLVGAMAYDKHGLLDLILYEDGHEEIRKPARKGIFTMPQERITEIVTGWLPALEGYSFHLDDVVAPAQLQTQAREFANLLRTSFPTVDFRVEGNSKDERRLSSTHQLVVDLAESITRSEKAETYITTNLFLFLACSQLVSSLEWECRQVATGICVQFLRSYIGCVLCVEAEDARAC
ncbi:hypothetical protein P154DRAFT_527122 [Amniculicola lignicola CBS 123094]|uniref:Uncharacterized protein n=1 Tax=Amniculicola lignicola CBS 123094 TaxID=1392246 RepID=A0A6A5VZI2_9PLEO|nr:hypothetical protein P154DRAFT_527122 [Amniculicola lignicola CBS 123094]